MQLTLTSPKDLYSKTYNSNPCISKLKTKYNMSCYFGFVNNSVIKFSIQLYLAHTPTF